MKSSARIIRLPRRWSGRSRRCETCNLHGEPRVQVACQLRFSTSAHSQSLRYFSTMTNTQTSTHSDDPLRLHQHEGNPPAVREQLAPDAAPRRVDRLITPSATHTTEQDRQARPDRAAVRFPSAARRRRRLGRWDRDRSASLDGRVAVTGASRSRAAARRSRVPRTRPHRSSTDLPASPGFRPSNMDDLHAPSQPRDTAAAPAGPDRGRSTRESTGEPRRGVRLRVCRPAHPE